MVAETLKIIVDADARKANNELAKLDRNLSSTTKEAGGASNSFAGAAKSLAGMAAAGIGIGVVVSKVSDLAKAGFQAAAQFEVMEAEFSVLTGSMDTASALMDEMRQFSAMTPMSVEAIAESGKQLMSFGTDIEDVIDQIQVLGDISLGNEEKLSRLTLAFGKIQARGKASMEELNMLLEAGVPILDQLSQNFGITQEAIFKMVSEGKVGFSDVQQALEDLTGEGGQFNGGMEVLAQTFQGKVSTAMDQFKNAGATLFEPFLDGVGNFIAGLGNAVQELAVLEEAMERNRDLRTGEAAGITLEEYNRAIEVTQQLRDEEKRLADNRRAFANETDEVQRELNEAQLERQERIIESLRDEFAVELRIIAQRRREIDEQRNADLEAGVRQEQALAAAEAEADAEERKTRELERQAQIEEQYRDIRQQVLSILESEKTELDKLREQAEALQAVEWAPGFLEDDRIEALAIINERIKELTESSQQDAIATTRASLAEQEQMYSEYFGGVREMAEDAGESIEDSMDKAQQRIERIKEQLSSVALDAVSSIATDISDGGEIDYSGIARSAIVGITDAFAPGFGQVAGAAVDVFEAAWNKMFGASEQDLEAARERASARLFEISDSYRTEAELRRQYVDELQDIFGIEQQILRDQFERGILNVSEFREQGTALNVRAAEEIEAGEVRAQQEAAADLEAARQEKISKIDAAIAPLQKELDKIYDMGWQWFTKRDNELEEEIAELQRRKTRAQTATSIDGVMAAAMGADFMTNGPQLLMVGERGREHVMVDPAPGKGGPKGQTITINVANAYGIDDLEMQLMRVRKKLSRRGVMMGAA